MNHIIKKNEKVLKKDLKLSIKRATLPVQNFLETTQSEDSYNVECCGSLWFSQSKRSTWPFIVGDDVFTQGKRLINVVNYYFIHLMKEQSSQRF